MSVLVAAPPTVAVRPPIATTRAVPWRRVLTAAAPGALFLAVGGLGVLILAWMSGLRGKPLNLHAWDGNWYLAIARHGYLGVDPSMADAYGHRTATTSMAFFPGYPLLVRAVAPLFAGDYLVAGVVVSTVAGVAAAYGLHRLARMVTGSDRAALLTVVMFAAAPMAIVYSMTYPQALLMAATAWSLVGVMEHRWLLAGSCAAVAGLVSPMGLPMIVVVMATAGMAAFTGMDRMPHRPPMVALLAAPAGMYGYLLWVAAQTGSIDGYLDVQRRGWGSGFDFGWSTAQWIVTTLVTDTAGFAVLTALFTLSAVALLVLCARRLPWPVWTYAAVTVVFTVGSSGAVWDKVRLLLVGFPLLIPVAAGLVKRRGVALLLPMIGLVAVGLWFSAYSLTVWTYSI
ncbi:MAG: hypothetical protein ACRDSP_00065 [Pseudonocardiaceae bacterium]